MLYKSAKLNLCKKVTGEKVSGKKPGKKTLIRKSQFTEVLGRNVTKNKVLSFRFLGLFSLNNTGAAIKVSGNKITGIKVLKKKSETFL